nr:TPA_asm: ND2 [Echinogammarus veneris]
MLSVVVATSSNSWFMIWLSLEINLLSFIPLLTSNKNKYTSEAALKYFLIQSFASVLIIASASLNLSQNLAILFLAGALFLKLGAAPSHQWLPSMIDGLSWPMVSLLLTVQKFTPLILIFFLFKTNHIHMFYIFYMSFSALIGAIGGLSQSSLRKIMAYSSIAHLAWMLVSLQSTMYLWGFYFFIYSSMLMMLSSLLYFSGNYSLTDVISMKKSYFSLILAISFLSLGGLPPFTGFLPKLVIIQDIFLHDQVLLSFPLLTSSFISLFFYMRVILYNLLLSNSQYTFTKQTTTNKLAMLNFNFFGLLAPSALLIFL